MWVTSCPRNNNNNNNSNGKKTLGNHNTVRSWFVVMAIGKGNVEESHSVLDLK